MDAQCGNSFIVHDPEDRDIQNDRIENMSFAAGVLLGWLDSSH